MRYWDSSKYILQYSKIFPEVVGEYKDILYKGIYVDQKEKTTKPICKECGYTVFEWLMHWSKTLEKTIITLNANEKIKEYIKILKKKVK